MANIRSTVVNPESLKVATYSTLSPRDARRKIKRLLDQTALMVSPEKVSAARAGRQTGEGNIPDRVPGKAIVHGVTYVNCSNDGSENNHAVEYGKPVCFNMVTGQGATGINPAWGTDEYKVLGTALGDVATGSSRIPVLLGVQPNDNFAIVAKCTPNVSAGHAHHSLDTWSSAVDMIDQPAVWDFELPKDVSFAEDEDSGAGTWNGSGSFVRACNLTRQYIYKEMYVLLHSSGKPKLQFFCEFYMAPTIYGTLNDGILTQGGATLTIDPEVGGGIEGSTCMVYDRMLDVNAYLNPGTKILATLQRTGFVGDDSRFTWKYFITQANQCPGKI